MVAFSYYFVNIINVFVVYPLTRLSRRNKQRGERITTIMKKTDLFFTAILVPLDYLMLILAGIIVYLIRFQTIEKIRPVIYEIPFKAYFSLICLIAAVWLIVFALTGLYSIYYRPRFSVEISKVFLACSVGTMLIVLFVFFRRELLTSRFIVVAGWIVSIIFVLIGRFLVHLIKLYYFKKGRGLQPIIILGHNQIASEIIKKIRLDPGLGYKILDNPETVDELIEKWRDNYFSVNEIIQTEPNLSREDLSKLINFCNEHQIIFKYVADLFGALSANVRTDTLAGLPIVEIKRTALDGWGKIIKRVFDIVFSILGLIIFSPLFLVTSLLIIMDSPGPIFVSLERVGERGKHFKLYKFRSMVKNAEALKKDLLKYNERAGPLFKIKNDPRITRIGKFLRRTSIDELPQLFNVLIGQMSLVGPRPHEPQEVAQYQKNHKQLLTIKPGITGLAQISGRSELPFDEEARLDIYYIENWSLSLDIQILIKTIPAVLSRKNVA